MEVDLCFIRAHYWVLGGSQERAECTSTIHILMTTAWKEVDASMGQIIRDVCGFYVKLDNLVSVG